jgi:acetylglutamate kinase
MTSTPRPHINPVVVKVGGALLDTPDARSVFLDRFAEAANAGTPLALVHGGGAAVDRHLDRLGVVTERRDGIRITPPELMPEIAAILVGQVSTGLLSELRARGTIASALRLADDEGIKVERLNRNFDPGAVGTVTGGHATLLRSLIASGRVPLIASIGMLEDGTILNINADDAASGVARSVGARALLLLTDVPGVLDANGSVIRTLDSKAIKQAIRDGVITGGMIPKVEAALSAAADARCPVVIGSWSDARVLSHPLAADTIATSILPPTTIETNQPWSPTPVDLVSGTPA